ncbi:MAG: type III-B CRISPR module-associated protein Cmr5 [Candidatus Brocadia carolinensis]|uniref:CRISPR type III-B/RAMP module-associated protein Cmr5 n=1 Tax=Candidatus Brocadia carolinensis TaxID=1004156 RepID=A0A1V4ARA3_9BACT|nr:MAG: type III-B CRISPR module-associated protein Cmr5 [Candidatus Brocadia caroliniensis]
MSRLQTIEQKRAKVAWSYIDYVNNDLDPKEIGDIQKFKNEYCSTVMKLSSLILTNGLGQTLAFLKSKGKGDKTKPQEKVYQHLQEWLTSADVINWGRATEGELIERVMKIDNNKYRFVTMQTLSFLNWLKRFADAVLKDGGE